MKKRIVSLFAMLFCLVLPLCSAAAADQNQVSKQGGVLYYDASGQPVDATSIGNNGAIVSMEKTIKDVDSSENLFDITLKVETTENIETFKNLSPDAAVTLVLDYSSSMKQCVKCGHDIGNSCHNEDSACDYRGDNEELFVSRMDAAKKAAKDFVDRFASMGVAQGSNTKRLVSIVIFDKDATTLKPKGQYYLDVANTGSVTTSNDRQAVKDAIDNIDPHSGTNIEAGMLLARNLQYEFFDTGKTYEKVDYLYTILLTDGKPYNGAPMWNLTEIDQINAANDANRDSHYRDDLDDITEDIYSLSSLAKIYCICQGFEGDNKNGTATKDLVIGYDNIKHENITIGTWLDEFTDAVYGDDDHADADSILGSFDSIIEQITKVANAWKVTDVMGKHIDYVPADSAATADGVITYTKLDDGTEQFVWDLTKVTPDISGNVRTYTYTYRVRLNNLNPDCSGKFSDPHQTKTPDTPANTLATLDYAVLDSVSNTYSVYDDRPFPQPEVFGFNSQLSFTKVDQNMTPMSGVSFYVYANDSVAPFTTVTSDNEGVVTLNNIPSGHSYRIAEIPLPEYATLEDIVFDVSYGTLQSLEGPLTSEDGKYYAKNIPRDDENSRIDLKIVKKFMISYEGENYPVPETVYNAVGASAIFTVTHPHTEETAAQDTGHTVHLYKNKKDGTKLEDLIPGISTNPHTITETASEISSDFTWTKTDIEVKVITHTGLDDDGNPTGSESTETLPSKTVTIGSGSAVQPDYTFTPNRKTTKPTTYEVTYTNYFTPLSGTITVNKYLGRHNLENNHCTTEEQKAKSTTVTIGLFDEYGNLLTQRDTKDGTVTFTNVPLGKYVVKELAPETNIDDYTWIHAFFTHEKITGTNSTGTETDISIDATVGYEVNLENHGDAHELKLENHYLPYRGQISVRKDFSFDDLPSDTTAAAHFAALYKKQHNGAEPSITFNIRKNGKDGDFVSELVLSEDKAWVAVSGYLPAGTYYIEEVASGAQLDGYTHQVQAAGYIVTIDEGPIDQVVHYTLTNAYTRNKANLTITKQFADSSYEQQFAGRSIAVHVMRQDKTTYDTVLLNRGNGWTKTLENVPQDVYELVEEITRTHENTAFLEGHSVVADWGTDGYNVTHEDWAAARAAASNGSTPVISRTVTNTYEQFAHSIKIEKKYAVNNVEGEMPAGYSVSLSLKPVDENNALIPGQEYRTAVLTPNASSFTFSLPKGRYRVEESITGEHPDYELKSAAFSLSDDTSHVSLDEDNEGNTILVISELSDHEHEAITLSIVNNYALKQAKLRISKSFSGHLAADLFESTVFNVEIFDNNNTIQDTTDDISKGTLQLKLQKKKDADGKDIIDYENSFVAESDWLDASRTYRLVETVEAPQAITHYQHTATWSDSENTLSTSSELLSVHLTPGQTLQLSLNNNYRIKQENKITLVKKYVVPGVTEEAALRALVHEKTAGVVFVPSPRLQGMEESYTYSLQGMHEQEFSLPLGTYKVYESSVPEIPNYSFASASASVTVASNGTEEAPSDFSETSPLTLEIKENDQISINVTNTYAPNDGKVFVTKEFLGYDDLSEQTVTFSFFKENDAFTVSEGSSASRLPVKTITLDKDYADPDNPKIWRGQVDLPVGTYSVTETLGKAPNAGERVTPTWQGLENGLFVVTPGGTVSIVCKNQLDTVVTAAIPFEKIIALGGNMPSPAGSIFHFSVRARLPKTAGLNLASHTLGPNYVPTYEIIETQDDYEVRLYQLKLQLDTPDTLSTYLEVVDFGDSFAAVDANLVIRESIYPFANEAEAAAAGWKYDLEKEYTVSLAQSTVTKPVWTITNEDGRTVPSVSFTNTFTQNLPADIPQTGDGSSLPLWALVLLGSGSLLLLRFKKRKA